MNFTMSLSVSSSTSNSSGSTVLNSGSSPGRLSLRPTGAPSGGGLPGTCTQETIVSYALKSVMSKFQNRETEVLVAKPETPRSERSKAENSLCKLLLSGLPWH